MGPRRCVVVVVGGGVPSSEKYYILKGYAMFTIVRHTKGEIIPNLLSDAERTWPYHTLGIKWRFRDSVYGGVVTYAEKSQLWKAWVYLIWGIIRNLRNILLSRWAEPVPFRQFT